jgi:hypothetical protein
MRRTLVCAALIVLAGCVAPAAESGSDPGTDRLGWENGYRYDDPIAVNATDGLNKSEREAVRSRQMARLEQTRGLEFERPVELRVITREEYLRTRGGGSSETHEQWNNQVWEALFLVGEDTAVDEAFNDTLGSSVQGYYRTGSDEVVLVSDRENPVVDRGTLIHELVHALQDQQFGLDDAPETQDRQLARNSVVEGEANLLEDRYEQRCGDEWNCVRTSSRAGGGGELNRGVLLVILAPYVQGPEFVATVQKRSGWDAVDALHREYPESTKRVLKAESGDEQPVDVTVPDRSSDDWERFDHDPVADTVGPVSIHAAFFQNGVQAATVERYSYAHPAARGWTGDTLVPYQNGDRYGYVWETAWESEAEARQFEETYRALLDSEGAQFQGEGGTVAVVPETSAFDDAFRVTRDGRRVRVVNGPTVESLSRVHAN